MNEVLARLNAIIEKHYGGSKPDFARAVGKPPYTLNSYFSQNSKPGSDFLVLVLSLGFSSDWLLSGEGDMYAQNAAGRAYHAKETVEDKQQEAAQAQETVLQILERQEKRQKLLEHDIDSGMRFRIVRRWLTESGTLEEMWAFMLEENVEVSLNTLLALESRIYQDTVISQDVIQWLGRRGINPDWLLGFADEPFTLDEAGENLRERVLGKYKITKDIKRSKSVISHSESSARTLHPA